MNNRDFKIGDIVTIKEDSLLVFGRGLFNGSGYEILSFIENEKLGKLARIGGLIYNKYKEININLMHLNDKSSLLLPDE